MKCPNCQNAESKVVESRDVVSGESIRRRRECLACKHRYTTYERLERPSLVVVKKDGTRQLYDRAKLVSGLQRACEKTTIDGEQFEDLVSQIEKAIYDKADTEITTHKIGEIAMSILAKFSQVAYVRFASVYRCFTDVDSFERELKIIKSASQK
ncbi:MAG TPA: transcriptional regulator NrdR [Candidatus Saccharimonadales bacterium]|nr:transcriptional regulator NrdR [Candidatus Saccharimonadales bacterium]